MPSNLVFNSQNLGAVSHPFPQDISKIVKQAEFGLNRPYASAHHVGDLPRSTSCASVPRLWCHRDLEYPHFFSRTHTMNYYYRGETDVKPVFGGGGFIGRKLMSNY